MIDDVNDKFTCQMTASRIYDYTTSYFEVCLFSF